MARFLLFFLLIASLTFVDGFSSRARSRVFVGTPVRAPRRCVGDCMTQFPMTLSTSTPIDEAMEMMLRLGISGAPVVDATGRIVGIVSNHDFLTMESGGALLPMEGTAKDVEGYAEVARKIVAQQVGDVMTPDPMTVSVSMSMRAAAELMSEKKLNRLPVVENGVLVGILSSSDVMRDLLPVLRAALPEASEGVVDEKEMRP